MVCHRVRRDPVVDDIAHHPALNSQIMGNLNLGFAQAAQPVVDFNGIHMFLMGSDKLLAKD